MPVSKSAKQALRTAERRHLENISQKNLYKKTTKAVRKAVEQGSDDLPGLFSKAQSALDRAAKNNTIHPNKAARLKSRLYKSTLVEKPTLATKEKLSKIKTSSQVKKTPKK
jgi:small subunit ribosomal protein S20